MIGERAGGGWQQKGVLESGSGGSDRQWRRWRRGNVSYNVLFDTDWAKEKYQ